MVDAATKEILRKYRKIAVVGISPDRMRASNGVTRYMIRNGYEVYPVNPKIEQFEGIPAYPDLESVPGEVQILNIFRRPEYVPDLVEAGIRKGVKVIWMQSGVVHEQAAARAREAGITVIMDRCIMQDHLAQRWEAQ
jgi:predicted CoA-binding protein